MELSRFHDLGHEFSKLIQVDFIHFLGHFLIEYVFFKKHLPSNNLVFFYLVFFFQFHLSILDYLEIEHCNFLKFYFCRVIPVSLISFKKFFFIFLFVFYEAIISS
jgi:hypothetical protein